MKKVTRFSYLYRLPSEYLPAEEISRFIEFLRDNQWCLDPGKVIVELGRAGKKPVLEDDFTKIIDGISDAIKYKLPYSVIRIGDGESNFLCYSLYPFFVKSSRAICEASLRRREDRVTSIPWNYSEIEAWMKAAVVRADVIGIQNLSRPTLPLAMAENFVKKDPRSFVGMLSGAYYMRELARAGRLQGILLTDIRIQLAIIKAFVDLPRPASGVIAITSRPDAVDTLRRYFDGVEVRHVEVGVGGKAPRPDVRSLVRETMAEVPRDLKGWLVLVGAGPWSELYCQRVKERGGVGIDLGSGFDLLGGEKTRPEHRPVDVSRIVAGDAKGGIPDTTEGWGTTRTTCDGL